MLNSTGAATQTRAASLAEVARAAVTLVVTETVRPTWIITESVIVFTNTVSSEEKTSLPETAPQSAEPTDTAQRQISPQSLQADTTSPISVPTTVPLIEDPTSRSAEYWPGFLGHLTVQTSWDSESSPSSSLVSPSPPSSESSSSPTLLTTSSSVRTSVLSSMTPSSLASTPARETMSSISPATRSSTSPYHSPTFTPLSGLGSNASSTESFSGQSHHRSPGTGTIVGSAIGGAAVVALGLLACFFFFRRKRTLSHQRQASRQRLLRTSESMSSTEGFHRRQFSQPLPATQFPVTDATPIFHSRRYSNTLDNRPSPAVAACYPNLSHDRVNPYGEMPCHLLEDSFADPEAPPLSRGLSPIIEVSPPTRSASLYSRSSWDGGLNVVESHEPIRISPYGCTYPSRSTLTLETSGSGSRYQNTPKSHSRRSDPFDLESPANTLQWPFPASPRPNRWGSRF
ncbi:uncharacterized protein N7498_000449 [Penicillium cinerascens]|uniref:Uncharacterized protein n=1 Tax=Penicillium cinerascens TaxID=70096 RepID=A0A9W9NEF1_9EURO|nr:uncharacterized protein N7498_000449 [Penicillium cinerascens]KAJ5218350.1 hypothetical protein N7498_000449 [Penicillium cinerascens]